MLTFRGSARRAGCSERSIRAAIARGELQAYANFDGQVKMLVYTEVDDWAAGRRFGKPGRPAKQYEKGEGSSGI